MGQRTGLWLVTVIVCFIRRFRVKRSPTLREATQTGHTRASAPDGSQEALGCGRLPGATAAPHAPRGAPSAPGNSGRARTPPRPGPSFYFSGDMSRPERPQQEGLCGGVQGARPPTDRSGCEMALSAWSPGHSPSRTGSPRGALGPSAPRNAGRAGRRAAGFREGRGAPTPRRGLELGRGHEGLRPRGGRGRTGRRERPSTPPDPRDASGGRFPCREGDGVGRTAPHRGAAIVPPPRSARARAGGGAGRGRKRSHPVRK